MSLIIKTTGFEDYLDRSGGSWVKELIFGAPDVGKTRSASFWPKPIFADCEDGRMSIADRKVQYGRVRSSADMDALLEELRKDGMRPMASLPWQHRHCPGPSPAGNPCDCSCHDRLDPSTLRWRAQPNDVIGGWCVTAEDDSRTPAEGSPGFADFVSQEIAEHIAALHNASLVLP